jgi:phosphate transport system permease protein
MDTLSARHESAGTGVRRGEITDLRSGGRLADRLFAGASTASGLLVIALVTAVAVFLLSQALPVLARDDANFLTDRVWDLSDPSSPMFGIPDLLWVTVLSSLMAMALAVPVAIAVALCLTQYASARFAAPLATLVDLLAAVPSVIFGLWGFMVLRPHVQSVEGALSGVLGWIPLFSPSDVSGTIFLASIVLAIMILPVITALSREVFAKAPLAHREAALALGATRWEMIRTAVLPYGRAGVISASMLGLGRALGETIAVAFILSQVRGDFSVSLFTGGETFASKIANNAAEFDSPTKTGAFIAAGLVLFALTFAVNAVARVVIERRKAFSE